MSSQHVQHLPHGIAGPRIRPGSLRTVVTQRLHALVHSIWDALEAVGQRRSEIELLALAERWKHTHPALARELRSHARGGSSY